MEDRAANHPNGANSNRFWNTSNGRTGGLTNGIHATFAQCVWLVMCPHGQSAANAAIPKQTDRIRLAAHPGDIARFHIVRYAVCQVEGCMPSVINRPFFSVDVLIIAGLVLIAAFYLSQWLAIGLYKLLF